MVAQDAVVLRPRGVGELFDQAIRLYRKHFIKFIGIIAIAQIPIEIVRLIVNFFTYSAITSQGITESPSVLFDQTGTQALPLILYSLLTFLIIAGVASAALTTAINKSYLGEAITIEDAYLQIRGRWPSLLGGMLLLILFNIPILIWSLIPCIGWITGTGMFFFVNAVLGQLIAPIIIIERRPASQALRRAWDLTRRRFWWICAYFILLALFGLLVVQGPVITLNVLLLGQIENWVTADNISSMIIYRYAIDAIVSLATNLLYLPLAGTCAALAYFDLRVRQEGFDLAVQANEASGAPLEASEVASQSPALETGSIITWKEMGFFAGLSLIGVALYTVLITAFYMVIFALVAFLQ